MIELAVILPVYNEEACVEKVLLEWIPVLRTTLKEFKVYAINDGSKDKTLQILQNLSKQYQEIEVIDKPNTGHGQSCIYGYSLALTQQASWILQIDSDGQCDPKFFPDFWQLREQHPIIYGFRSKRDDGKRRYIFSRIVSLVVLLGIGEWVPDANVPYRLMKNTTIEPIIKDCPKDFHLANILVSALQQKEFGIFWKKIHFRNRIGGVPSVKAYSFAKQGLKLLVQLLKLHLPVRNQKQALESK